MRWMLVLGGLGLWLAHFAGVYLLASLADLLAPSGLAAWRSATLALSGVCLAGCGLVAWLATRPSVKARLDSPIQQGLAFGGAMLGGLAVAWQTLAAVL